MMRGMLRVCTVLLGVAATWAAVVPMKDFNPDEIEGKWYTIGFATNADWFSKHKDGMKMGTVMVQKTADGGLDMSSSSLKDDGSCWRMAHLLKKTDTPGQYTSYSERWRTSSDVHMVDVKGDEYLFMHSTKTNAGKAYPMTKLFSRTVNLSDDIKNKFKRFSQEAGILVKNIILLPPNGEC